MMHPIGHTVEVIKIFKLLIRGTATFSDFVC